jgi:IMP dehydrogenase
MKETLTFDDVQIVPSYSDISSRSDIQLTTQFTRRFPIQIPLVAAPMDTVCDSKMAIAMWMAGGVGIVHRFRLIQEQMQAISAVKEYMQNVFDELEEDTDINTEVIAAAIGANGGNSELIVTARSLLSAGANVLVIDVAHGHHVHVKNAITSLLELKGEYNFDIVAGSIATADAALDLQEWGADALRVGVGGGSVCETRIRTGIGVPQLQSIFDVMEVATVPVISDGGIRYPGDAAKALAAGASTVMCGSLFAGTDEAPGDTLVAGKWPYNKNMKIYRGMASATTKLKHKGVAEHVEGASKIIEAKGPVQSIIDDLTDGIKSSMSYVGASTLAEYRKKAKFVKITSSGLIEAHPHLL